jgi:hypothetical protein
VLVCATAAPRVEEDPGCVKARGQECRDHMIWPLSRANDLIARNRPRERVATEADVWSVSARTCGDCACGISSGDTTGCSIGGPGALAAARAGRRGAPRSALVSRALPGLQFCLLRAPAPCRRSQTDLSPPAKRVGPSHHNTGAAGISGLGRDRLSGAPRHEVVTVVPGPDRRWHPGRGKRISRMPGTRLSAARRTGHSSMAPERR